MIRRCEVCQAQGEAGTGKLRRLLIGERIVALCASHAAQAEATDADSIEQLRATFPEPNGRRSLVDRRSPLDRRVFPARPEGRRAQAGRRVGEA
ncbi:MAG: hypothetical protein QM756_21030 [Polyangiaceae bacterium]